MIGRLLIMLFCLCCGLSYSSVLLVKKLGLHNLPKSEVFKLFSLKFAPPWLWAKWFFFYNDKTWWLLKQTMWPIYVGVFLGVALALIYSLLEKKQKESTAHGSSRWANKKEISSAGLFGEQGVVLGRIEEKIIRHDGPEHVLVIAPTRGGKGVGIVVPSLLEWSHSAVVFDPKGENWQITSGFRATLGPCFCFDPTTFATSCFNPLMEIRKGELEVKDAQNIADIIIDPDGRLENRNHWQNAAHSLLVGTILHVIYECERKSLAGVVEFLTRSNTSFEKSLEEMAASANPVVKSVAAEMLNKHIEERSGVLSTAVSLLSIFRDPLVANATDSHDFSIDCLKNGEKPVSLYLVLPPSDISRLRVLIRLMLNQMGRVLTQEQVPNTRRILFLLDEFPSLGRLEFFESALAYIAGYGLKAMLICQSLNQLQKAYGERNAILDNCHVRVAFANNDDQTAKRLSDLLGSQTLSKQQFSMSGSRLAMYKQNASLSNIEFARPLLMPAEINRLDPEREIVLVNGCFPILASKVKYFKNPAYQKKLSLPVKIESKKKKLELAAITTAVSVVEAPTATGSSL